MIRPLVVFSQRQPPLPEADDEQDLADHDLKYLLKYLALSRQKSYVLRERPDEQERNKAAPDYIVQEMGSKRLIAIERTQLLKQDAETTIARLMNGGADVVVGMWGKVNPNNIAQILAEALARKIARGQLHNVNADERILLIRNGLPLATEKTFSRVSIPFDDKERGMVDHAYLIASSRLLELW